MPPHRTVAKSSGTVHTLLSFHLYFIFLPTTISAQRIISDCLLLCQHNHPILFAFACHRQKSTHQISRGWTCVILSLNGYAQEGAVKQMLGRTAQQGMPAQWVLHVELVIWCAIHCQKKTTAQTVQRPRNSFSQSQILPSDRAHKSGCTSTVDTPKRIRTWSLHTRGGLHDGTPTLLRTTLEHFNYPIPTDHREDRSKPH